MPRTWRGRVIQRWTGVGRLGGMDATEFGPSLLAAFARVPDVRSRHGRRSPLPALLTLGTAARLCGARSRYASAQWGRLQPEVVRRALGIRGSPMPGITTRHDVFKRLDVPALETELPAWAAQALDAQPQPRVLDGQARRGRSSPASAWWPWTLLRPAWCWRQRGGRTNEEPAETEEAHAPAKQEAERSVAPRLLTPGRPPLAGRRVSGDARSCQNARCRHLRPADAD
jgi:hypothetical protein